MALPDLRVFGVDLEQLKRGAQLEALRYATQLYNLTVSPLRNRRYNAPRCPQNGSGDAAARHDAQEYGGKLALLRTLRSAVFLRALARSKWCASKHLRDCTHRIQAQRPPQQQKHHKPKKSQKRPVAHATSRRPDTVQNLAQLQQTGRHEGGIDQQAAVGRKMGGSLPCYRFP